MTEIAVLARRLVGQRVNRDLALDLAVDSVSASASLDLEAERELRQSSQRQTLGFGKLQDFLDDALVEELWINRPDEVFLARCGVVERVLLPLAAGEIAALVERMLRSTGRRLDRTTPFVDAALPDGTRLHVVIPDISREHWSVNLRKFPRQIWQLGDLVERIVLTRAEAQFLGEQVLVGRNILVSGGTHTGKTTVLCALIEESRAAARLVSVEETFEIRSNKSDWVALQTRQASTEGSGEVTLRRLVKESLRMRPDLLVVGEVREAESLDLLIAMNSGIQAMCTIHANSAKEAITKLCTLPLLAGQNIPQEFVQQTVASCVDLVVHCQIDNEGNRKIAEIARVHQSPSGVIELTPIRMGDL